MILWIIGVKDYSAVEAFKQFMEKHVRPLVASYGELEEKKDDYSARILQKGCRLCLVQTQDDKEEVMTTVLQHMQFYGDVVFVEAYATSRKIVVKL